jgi:hypothetical protein
LENFLSDQQPQHLLKLSFSSSRSAYTSRPLLAFKQAVKMAAVSFLYPPEPVNGTSFDLDYFLVHHVDKILS